VLLTIHSLPSAADSLDTPIGLKYLSMNIAAIKARSISRRGAKAAKEEPNSELGVLGALAREKSFFLDRKEYREELET
jgi:hypothetical protein